MISKKHLTLAAASAAVLATPVIAGHSWSNYHWERTTNEISPPVVDFTTGEWAQSNRVQQAVNDWNRSAYINSDYVRGQGNNTACPIVAGEIHVCNDDYGNTGWVGIASISATRGRTTHIIGGVSKMNDYFYAMPYYDNDIWRQLVMCQEIGHDYGLGHQNENFNSHETDSCMEYTSTPDAADKTLNQHDLDQLASIYAHSHGGGDGGGGSGNGGGKGKPKKFDVGNRPADWGTPIGRDAQGRANLFKRSEASFDVITHVTWAIGEGPDGDHDHGEHEGPRQHSGDRRF
uniref:hypothetical protein n=1 Tax=uncultured Altererythrobacter sp. TaxID=500840 RepID=UPI002621F7C6|nr:hypothetical protein [uncultured Altererythrobacter sp.]